MLPSAYGLPAAVVLVLAGALACVAGYRLFRLVLGIYGFLLGALVASSIMSVNSTAGMLIAAVAGGLIGAIVLVFASFVGIALVGAGLGALVAHVIWSQLRAVDPPPVAVVAASITGALGAMLLQRYVIIVATAFGGAWTVVAGALALVERRGARDVWIWYPLPAEADGRWIVLGWVALGLIGTTVQLALTARRR